MGRVRNAGIGIGTVGSPQGGISQGNVDAKLDELTSKIKPFDSSKFDYKESMPKYDGYLLDINHIDGGSKAKFLKDVLGYEIGDGARLHKAIGQAIDGKIPDKVKITEFGTKYNFNVKLFGKDGNEYSANVTIVVQNDNGKTMWRLITLTPGKKDK